MSMRHASTPRAHHECMYSFDCKAMPSPASKTNTVKTFQCATVDGVHISQQQSFVQPPQAHPFTSVSFRTVALTCAHVKDRQPSCPSSPICAVQ
jgi:hypothetical protein